MNQKQKKQAYDPFNDQQQIPIEQLKSPVQKLQMLPQNTLDQTICSSVLKQIKSMLLKFWCVLIPIPNPNRRRKLRNWDLWGPFLMCLILGLVLQSNQQLIIMLGLVFIGGLIVGFNSKVLGAKISILQSISILGYCIFPLFLVTVILKILFYFKVNSEIAKIVCIIAGILWSIFAARAFLTESIQENKVFVSLYPICLFYIFIGSIIGYM